MNRRNHVSSIDKIMPARRLVRKPHTALVRLLLCSVLVLVSVGASSANTALVQAGFDDPASKIDPWIIETAEFGETEFLVFLTEQADLSQAAKLATKTEKGEYVYEKLTETARRTQGPILNALKQMTATGGSITKYRPFWVVNAIWVRGSSQAVQQLARRPDVAHLYANPSVQIAVPEQTVSQAAPEQTDTVEWNIQKVRAPMVWSAGYTGQGAVVAGQDTGYDWDHPALKDKYRGWDGSSAVHDYNWHDAIHADDPHTPVGNRCGFSSPVPCSDTFHGTHTMGTMVGDDGTGNQIGMAPGARWIGCRNMEENWGKPDTYSECFEWFIAPTDLNGNNPRPDLAPDVINNSWACPISEGCTDPNALKTVVENVRAAGILTVQSAGNSGPSCSSINTPAAIYDASFTVGSTDQNDIISSFSSRGPVTIDGSSRMKPDVSAPGSYLRSSYPLWTGAAYGTSQGTSMAAPHVAGLTALLLSFRPDLKGDVDAIEDMIRYSAIDRTTDQLCGTIPGTQVPNNTYGWGRIDAWNLYIMSSMQLTKFASPTAYEPGKTITFTLQVTNTNPLTLTHNILITDVIPADTIFITATLPHTKTGDTVVWGFPTLDANQSETVDLVLQTSEDAPGPIVNQDYSATSDEVLPVFGDPLYIYKIIKYFFPMMIQ